MTRQTKVYDAQGVLLDLRGAKAWFRENHPELFQGYFIDGDKDKELKRKLRPRVVELNNHATENGLYPISPIEGSAERLKEDGEQGYHRVIFTSTPKKRIELQLDEVGLLNSVDRIVTLYDIREALGLGSIMKEDPSTYEHLARALQRNDLDLKTYTDDGLPRVLSAVEANQALKAREEPGLGRIYHFDPKATPEQKDGYRVITSLADVVA